ncbi:MAG TPA: AAA family ATPase [Chitinophagaceae bacterium]
MELRKASRQRAKIKLALQGPSGSGKTFSALYLAFGLCGDWTKIAVVDTENHSAELYSHLGTFNTVSISAPFTPEKYIEAIQICEKSGIEVIIIDSCSHEWDGAGGILDIHGNMAGNSFTNWSKLTPRHNAFVQIILQSSCHIIGTIRSKQDYVLQEKNGKMVPEKVGMKGVTRDGMDYEFTLVFELDIKHNAVASKDRTGLFEGKPESRISISTGKQILEWCNLGSDPLSLVPLIEVQQSIDNCKTVEELLTLYKTQSASSLIKHTAAFTKRRQQLLVSAPNHLNHISHQLNPSTNGQHLKPSTSTE